MQWRHALSAGLFFAALGLAQAAGGCALVVGADFSDRELLACVPCVTGALGPCAQGCMREGACVSDVTPALERCDTEDIDESCDGAAACDGEVIFAEGYGDPTDQDQIRAAVDSQGNIIFAVMAAGTIDYGGSELGGTGLQNVHLVKLGPDGSYLGSTALTGGTSHYLGGLDVDAEDNILISGAFAGPMQFNGVPLEENPDGQGDIFVAKFSPDFTPVWIQVYTGPARQWSSRLAVDGSGNVFIIGGYDGSFAMGENMHTFRGVMDAFIAKLDAEGNLQWSCDIGGTNEDAIDDVVVGPGGEVVVTGSFIGAINLRGMSDMIGDIDSRNGFIAAYRDDCVYAWSQPLNSTDETRGQGLALDDEQRVLVTGFFSAGVDFGGAGLGSAGSTDVFLAAYHLNDGVLQWVQQFGDAAPQQGIDATTDPSGNVILVGIADGQIDFGAQVPLVANVTDAFVAKFSPPTDMEPGKFLWNHLFTGPAQQLARTVTSDALGNLVVTGLMSDRLAISGTVLDYAGAVDVWVAKLRP